MEEWYRDIPLPDMIVPVPLHASRLQERGFNQALEIARPLAKTLGLPMDSHRCLRIKPTPPQMTLSADKRRKNMSQAFQVNGSFNGMTVAILDDVVTTGNTVAELGRMIKAQGASEVHVWCCARA